MGNHTPAVSRAWRNATAVASALVIVLTGVALLAPKASAGSTRSVLATGQITFPPGTASGQVLAFADPSPDAVNADTAGTAMNAPLIASTNAASDGSFTLTLDPSQVPASAYLQDGKTINVEAIAVSGGQQQPFFFPATMVQTPTARAFVSTSTGKKPATPNIAFNMRGGSATNVKYNPAKWVSASGHQMPLTSLRSLGSSTVTKVKPTTARIAAAVANNTTTASAVCLLDPQQYIYGRPEHFVNVYDDGSTSAHIAEGASSTHTMGIALSTGSSWKQSGTASISRSASVKATSADRTHSWGYWNKVNYRQFLDSCIGTYRKPVGFYDIISADIDGSVQYAFFTNSCGQKAKGDTWDTGGATAATFGGGVSVAGITVSAQSGYSSDVNIHMVFLQGGSVRGSANSGIIDSAKVDSSTFPC